MQKAAEAIAKGDWAAAERALRRLAQGKGAGAQVFYNLAKVLIEGGKPQQAGAWFGRAVKTKSDYALAWFELGRWRLDQGALAPAAEAFARAAQQDPSDADAWRNAARLQERLCRFDAARCSWERLAALAPEDVEVRLGRARACFELGEPEAAEALLAGLPAEARAKALSVRTHVARGRLSLDPAKI